MSINKLKALKNFRREPSTTDDFLLSMFSGMQNFEKLGAKEERFSTFRGIKVSLDRDKAQSPYSRLKDLASSALLLSEASISEELSETKDDVYLLALNHLLIADGWFIEDDEVRSPVYLLNQKEIGKKEFEQICCVNLELVKK